MSQYGKMMRPEVAKWRQSTHYIWLALLAAFTTKTLRFWRRYKAAIRAAAESLRAAGAHVDYTARPDTTFDASLEIWDAVVGPSMAGLGVAPRDNSKSVHAAYLLH